MSVTHSVFPGDDSTLTREAYTGKHLAAITAAGITRTEVVIAEDPKRELVEVSVIVGERYAQQRVARRFKDDVVLFAAGVDGLAQEAFTARTLTA